MSTPSMRELLELRLAGQTLPPFDERNTRRVYCVECCDDGYVRVWHPRTVEEARKVLAEGKPLAELRTHYEAIAACVCHAGDAWHQRDVKGGGVRRLLPRFASASLCRLRFGTKNKKDHETLESWLANWRSANYERSFDSWNAGEVYVNQEIQF